MCIFFFTCNYEIGKSTAIYNPNHPSLIPIYSIISWLSYRLFHYSVYFETVRDCYEAFVLFALFALFTQYVGDHMTEEKQELIFYVKKKKDKKVKNKKKRKDNNENKDGENENGNESESGNEDQKFIMKYPFPCKCITYNAASKSHLLFVKWGVLQYVVINPIITFVALLTNVLGVYCVESISFKFANVYCKIINFVSVAIAMYSLVSINYIIFHLFI